MPQLNDQQREALRVEGVSIVLGAGAGCGKTTVLTERFVTALSGDRRIPLDRLVALTFTDKAAAELRGRVRAACRLRLDEGDEPEYWRGVLRGLEAAPIGTFHTFCGQVIRRFAIRAGIDPGYTILHPSVASTCREEAVDVCLRNALTERDRSLHDLAVAIGLEKIRSSLLAILGHASSSTLDTWARWAPEALESRWRELFETKVRPAVLQRFVDATRPCLNILGSHDCRKFPRLHERIVHLHDLIPSVPMATDPVAILEEIPVHARIQHAGTTNKTFEPHDQFQFIFTQIRDKHVKNALKGLKYDEPSTKLGAAQGLQMARLGARARREYERLKRERGVLDFDDLLVKTRDLLRDDSTPVLSDLNEQFDLILVDEFQDTDPIQDEIVRRIAGPTLDDGRLFLVGDFKQSIYSFRAPALPSSRNIATISRRRASSRSRKTSGVARPS